MPDQAIPFFTELAVNHLSRISIPAEEEVHIWRIPVSPFLSGGLGEGLTGTETARAGRFRQPADAARFSSARRALRQLAGAYLGIPPVDVEIAGDSQQKPFLANDMPRTLHFNVSHSGAVVLIAFGGRPVGIDTEAIDASFDPRDLLPEHFSDEEQSAIAAAPDAREAFYQLWTRKEAIVKGKGTGLQESLKQIQVLDNFPLSGPREETWRLLSFIVHPGYAAALACNVSSPRIVFYRAS